MAIRKFTVLNARGDFARQTYLIEISMQLADGNGAPKMISRSDMGWDTISQLATHLPEECRLVYSKMRPEDGYILAFEINPILAFSADVFINDGTDPNTENPIDPGASVTYVSFELDDAAVAPAETEEKFGWLEFVAGAAVGAMGVKLQGRRS